MRILAEEGVAGFYRGFGATMLNTFSMRTPVLYSLVSVSPQTTPQHRIRLFLLLLPRAHVIHKTVGCAEPERLVIPSLHRRRACTWRYRRRPGAGLHDPRGRHRYAPANRCAQGKG